MQRPNFNAQGCMKMQSGLYQDPRTALSPALMWVLMQYILDKTITVEKVDTKYQRADTMTKALPRLRDAFEFLRKTITGW